MKLHVRHILAKLNLTSRVEAAVFIVERRRRRSCPRASCSKRPCPCALSPILKGAIEPPRRRAGRDYA
ncbi:MAG: hypothetical protein MZW92_79025 [Comamonadaceae bacterium]|nr:hypothetical protein [Comamonadaceae bacterium]